MKLLVVAFVAVAVVAVSAAPQYTTKYDDINLDDILKSERLLKNYVNCLMERGNCTPDGKELKSVLPDALQTHCEKCNEKQKTGSEKMIRFLIKNKPTIWTELTDKYDPEHKYRTKYEDELKEIVAKA